MSMASFSTATGTVPVAASNTTTAGIATDDATTIAISGPAAIFLSLPKSGIGGYSSSVTQPLLALFTSLMYFASVPRVAL